MPGKMTARGSRRKSATRNNPRYLTLEYLQKEVLFFVMWTPAFMDSPSPFQPGDAPQEKTPRDQYPPGQDPGSEPGQ